MKADKTFQIGPISPDLLEPIRCEVVVKDGKIDEVKLKIGYLHRGVEKLMQLKTYQQNLLLAERICGICSHAHSTAYCQAVEKLFGIEVPKRARYIRTITLELERLQSHYLWFGLLGHSLSKLEYSLKVLSGREEALKILELIGGNRIHYGVNRIGGVRADLTLEVAKEIQDALYRIRAVSEYVYKSLDRDGEIGRLIRGKGVLKPEDAKRLGVVGPVLRSCGIASDIRRDSSYAAYPDLRFEVITEPDGDTQARAMVRIRETYESLKIIEQAVENIPCGELMGEIKEPLAGECFGRVEAPRGELVYFLVADGSNMPRGVKIRTPSYMNNSVLPLMLIGEREKEIQLILESIDPCIACTDRLVRIKRSG